MVQQLNGTCYLETSGVDFVGLSMDFPHKTLPLLAVGKEDVYSCPFQDVKVMENCPFKVKR